MFVHDGKTTLTLFRDLRLFWSTFNKNMCVLVHFSVLFTLTLILVASHVIISVKSLLITKSMPSLAIQMSH